MLEYKPEEIEKKWQKKWLKNKTYQTSNNYKLPKYYVLDMFPYPSGEGLHVGHPLGYIATDIVSRYKKNLGFNVLHPMGYDSFGLPAEQYAIQTGKHPALTTEINIKRYRQQLDRLGFSYDWNREIKTSEPKFYKWTQKFFIMMFNSWYDNKRNKAKKITSLIEKFNQSGTKDVNASVTKKHSFSSDDWKSFNEVKREEVLMNYRIAYLSEGTVNWCPKLGTVLANDEVKDGLSERGGHVVEQKIMKQWSIRISAYAERLLKGLEQVEFSKSLKEQQRNWIGKSNGATVTFKTQNNIDIHVFTTRLETIFGVSFLVLAPENKIVNKITTEGFKSKVALYKQETLKKSERQRLADKTKPTGQFTGGYAIHPITKKQIPVWISDYVLNDYGTGSVMAVPAGDQRDHDFAKEFKLDIPEIFENIDCSKSAYIEKNTNLKNSDFLDGLNIIKAAEKVNQRMFKDNTAAPKVNYRFRDAIFSRQRYWGEPFPVYYDGSIPKIIEQQQVLLPKISKFLPTEDGQPPLARAKESSWSTFKGDRMEYNTMPGWAGSSWYFLRFMDPSNDKEFAAAENLKYWNQVDLYVGGAEHAVGHLLYSRFWTKFLYDHEKISFNEPFKKLVNQGMIGGPIHFILLKKDKVNNKSVFVENTLENRESSCIKIACHIDFVSEGGTKTAHLNKKQLEGFIKWRPEYENAIFKVKKTSFTVKEILAKENVKFKLVTEQGKMSKRYFNTIDPEKICDEFGADTLRCYEMFLGPITEHKPWNINGISGVYNYFKKTWKLIHGFTDKEASQEELKLLHKTIKKITEDIDSLSFNTAISTFMITTNELIKLKTTSKKVFKDLLVLLSPFAPHFTEELWETLGNTESITKAPWPKYNEKYLVETNYSYPVSFNGKMRFKIQLGLDLDKDTIEAKVLKDPRTEGYLDSKTPKKVIVVPGKIVNIVI